MRNIISVFKKDANLDDNFIKIISTYNMADSIKSGKFRSDAYYDEILNSEEFSNFTTGKNIKELLFYNDNIESKRLYTEDYYKVS